MTSPLSLYFLPGTMCDSALWEQLWQKLPHSIKCHHIDIPQVDSISTVTDQILKQLPPNEINLVGFSLGGYLAANLATQYPNRITKLHIVSNCPTALPEQEIRQRNRTLNWLKNNTYQGMPNAKINQLLHGKHHNNSAIFERMLSMEKRLGVETLINQLKATTYRENLLETLAQKDFPVKFSFGDSDNLVSAEVMRDNLMHSQNCILECIKEVGHMLPLEAPDLLAESITNWFLQ